MENQHLPSDSYQNYLNKPMSFGDWFVTIFVTAIPLVGLIMLFIWAFSGDTNINKANWAKASLLWMVIASGLAFIFVAIAGLAVFSFMGDLSWC